jgi:hypothetical protein
MPADRAIRILHFGLLPAEAIPASWEAGPEAVVAALWPAPNNADVCFEDAGFDDFDDIDEAWDDEFRELAQRLLTALERCGTPALRPEQHGARSVEAQARRRGIALGLIDRLLIPTHDDFFAPCEVDFGDPPQATLRTGAAHLLFWVQLAHGGLAALEGIANSAAGTCAVEQLQLEWTPLIRAHLVMLPTAH